MNLAGCANNLHEALKELRAEWQRTSDEWRDAKSAEFADKYLDDLPNQIARAVTTIEELDAILKKIHRDCE